MNKTKNTINTNNSFDHIMIKVASPEDISEWSRGEVTKAETINYRTQRSEKSGLFDEKIFGPEKDYECYCGKYRGIRYKGIVCEKCGVELTRAIVRRERMGHIELAVPVAHIWFLRSMPSRLGMILGMSAGELEKVIYFAGYIVSNVYQEEKDRILRDLDSEFKAKIKNVSDEKTKEVLKEKLLETKREIESIKEGVVLDEVAYHTYSMKYSTMFEAQIGAEAIYNICREIDLPKLKEKLEKDLEKAGSLDREKINKRLALISSMIKSGLRPEWLFLKNIPVIPPALRPMVALEGGRFAASDVNDLYRRVINRNNRLKKLLEISAPDVILRNEKRILQEAVDTLVDSSIRHNTQSAMTSQAQKRDLKSLADNLKGKRGLFRQNLLGKRVDYSGRSVIVVGPELALNQCGLPKHMALELFRPFVISKLIEREHAYNIRGANRLIEDSIPEVWAILEEVTKEKYVLLNRAPTLHRLGIQAFKPILIEGNAIQVHPLVCTAFNADFDGDQMAVHVPLSEEAQMEAREIIAADKNILKPGSGNVVVSIDKLDIILGCYWMTKDVKGVKGENSFFSDLNEAILAFNFGHIDARAKIKVIGDSLPKFNAFEGRYFETTVGRILFNQALPDDFPFVNGEMTRKKMSILVEELIERYGLDNVPQILDKVKNFGFRYASYSGTTWGIDEVNIPKEKEEIVKRAKTRTAETEKQFADGLLSESEKYRKNIEIWQSAKSEVEKIIPESLDKNGSVYDLVFSGARGSMGQITQMIGMMGLIQNTVGETIEFPIISAMKEGLTPIEYFITTHGSRKGLTDTALNTAKAGYLTRKLFVVAQDLVISENDCKTKEGLIIGKSGASGIEAGIVKNTKGRTLAEDVKDKNGKIIFEAGRTLTKKDSLVLETNQIEAVKVRSPLTCESERGICAKCYGHDLGKNQPIHLGEAIGTVAAQAIGEPGTQLTMRTFHAGGTASVGGDITQGLPRVEELFEKRNPKNPAMISTTDGEIVEIRKEPSGEKTIIVLPPLEQRKKSKKTAEMEYLVAINRTPLVKVGDKVHKGDLLTDGSANLDDLFEYAGKQKTIEYVVKEVSKPYELQGESVSRKHIEVILRQMFSRKRVVQSGNTTLAVGDYVDDYLLNKENTEAKKVGGETAKAVPVIMGISEVSLSKSFLSAASFQHTTRVLVNASVRGSVDPLYGLMENVIIGRLIPAGTGFEGSPKKEMIKVLQESIDREMEEKYMREDAEIENAFENQREIQGETEDKSGEKSQKEESAE